MIRCDGQDKGILFHDVIVELRMLGRIRGRMHQGKVQFAGQKKLFQQGGILFADVQFDISAEIVEAGKNLREYQGPQMVGSAKMDASGL